MAKTAPEVIAETLEENFGLSCEVGQGQALVRCERGDIELVVFKPLEPGGSYRVAGKRTVEDQILVTDEPTRAQAVSSTVDIYNALDALGKQTDELERQAAKRFMRGR